MNSWTLYWFTRLDALKGLFGMLCFFGVLFGILSLVAVMAGISEGSEEEGWYKIALKAFKICLVFIFLGVSNTFIPNTKEMAFIYLTPKVIENKEVQKIPSNAIKLLNVKMEEYINESLTDANSK